MTNVNHRTDVRWQQPHIPGQVIIELVPGYDDKVYQKILTDHHAKEKKHIVQIGKHVVTCAADQIQPLLDALENAGLLASSEPDGIVRAFSDPTIERPDVHEIIEVVVTDGVAEFAAVTPNDPLIPHQWHLANIGMPNAWGITLGSKAVKLAVIDSGAYAHPDLTPNMVQGFSFLSYNNTTTDTGALGGHGTACAGTAAGVTDNALGIAGIAQVEVMPLQVLDATDYAAWSDVGDAITYAVDHGCRVMSISLGGTSDSSTLDSAATYAWSKGAVIFACAMNNHSNQPNYPAACQTVMAVAATAATNLLASFSNWGTWCDIAAPGVNIYTLKGTTGYANWSGTSLATPICAGVAALMISANPSITNSKICTILKQTASPVSGQPFGRINALAAIQAAQTA